MSKKIYYCIFVVLIIWNLLSLVYSPIAWFDEVFFASATHSLISGNGLSVELDHFEPLVIYGPVYFLLTGAVTKLFGFGIFQFRIVNLLFAFSSVLLLGKILNKLNVNKGMSYFIQILMLTDALFVSNSHSGRMECVALFFVLGAYLIYLSQFNRTIIKALLISTLLTLAVLTTLRVVVICIPIAIAQLIKFVKSHSWGELSVYLFTPLILYGIWVFVAFGSVSGMLSYFTQPPTDGIVQQSLFERFVKGNWMISKTHYPMILASLLSIFYFCKKGEIKDMVVFIAPIILYYFLVRDTGIYGVLILPFYMIIIALGITKIGSETRKYFHVTYKTILVLCMLVNCLLFIVKAYTVITTMERRDPRLARTWVKDNIPYGSKVAGDYQYYYAAVDNGCQFKRIFRSGAKDEVIFNDVIDNFQPDYIVLGKNNKKTEKLSLFQSSGFENVSCFEYKNEKNTTITKLLQKANFIVNTTYEGCIFKRN